ncbi:MAG: DUF4214 domain-containing protein [Gemmatimonadaceae bacterium]|nr:DUF4214 domain-containing protein [Acetobacteraceae bacterium]
MATKTWNGSNGPFASAASWSSLSTPASGDIAVITGGSVTATGVLPAALTIDLVSSRSSSPELFLSDATLLSSSQVNVTAGGSLATLRARGEVNLQGTVVVNGSSPGAAFIRIDDTVSNGPSRLLNTGRIRVTDTPLQVVPFGANPGNQFQNDGLISIQSTGAPLAAYVAVQLTGTGTIQIGIGATFEAASAVGAGQTFVFDQGLNGSSTLRMDSGTQFGGRLSGFASSDRLQLVSPRWDTAAYASTGADSGVLSFSLGGVVQSTLAFQGAYTLSSFNLQQSAQSGNGQALTLITTTVAEVAALPLPTPNNGTPGNDTFVDDAGNRLYLGGDGFDVLTLDEGRRGASFFLLGNGDVQFSHGGQTDILRGIEQVRFLDGREVFDNTDTAATITRMYQSGLGRVPDQSGVNFWIGRLTAGAPLAALAEGFLTSPEFAGRFGTTLSNGDFVTRIYQNVLGRDPEPDGFNFWKGNLDNNRATRAETLAGISESAENRAATAGQVSRGLWDISETSGQVARLYDTALGRRPDAGGLGFWTRTIDGGAALVDLANAFVSSAEFQSTYGALDNRAFVNAIYLNTLDRAGEADGVNFWTGVLNGGTSRAEVVVSFSESVEHQQLTQPNILNEEPRNYGILLA